MGGEDGKNSGGLTGKLMAGLSPKTNNNKSAMSDQQQFTSIRFQRYKAFRNYSVSLQQFNILVGPNNARIHQRKELENYLLVPSALERAIKRRIAEQNRRTGGKVLFDKNLTDLLSTLTAPLRHKIEAKYLARRRSFQKARKPSLDESTIDEQLMNEFEQLWHDPECRCDLVPGKDVLAALNTHLQETYKVTLSPAIIIDSFHKEEVPFDMAELIEEIEWFRKEPTE